MRYLVIVALLFTFASPSLAQENANPFRSTAYPLPRFVSLSSDEAYVRAGPGKKYPIQWVFKRAYLPLEIVLEFEHWRKIKDHEGQTGWIHKSLLSGRRTAIIQGDNKQALYKKPETDSRLAAYLEPGVIVRIRECHAQWCYIDAAGYKGWTEKEYLWGVYPDEIIEK